MLFQLPVIKIIEENVDTEALGEEVPDSGAFTPEQSSGWFQF